MRTEAADMRTEAVDTEYVSNSASDGRPEIQVYHIDRMGLPPKPQPNSPEKPAAWTINDVTDIVGPFGPWQLLVFLTVVYVEVIAAIYNYASPLLAAPVKATCDLNVTLEMLQGEGNSTYGELTLDDLTESSDHCQYTIALSGSQETRKCKYFNFTSVYSRSAAEEFMLICDRTWMISFTSSMTLLGDLIACLVFGHLADRIGRRKTMWIALGTTIVAPLVTLFSNTYTQFCIGRFLCGASGFGFMIISYVMLMEIVGIKYRALIGILVKLGYTIGGVYLGLMAYWLRNWFNIQIASTIPVIILVILCYVIPESPRWLIANGFKDQAEEVLEKASRWNRVSTKDLTPKVDQLSQKILSEMEQSQAHYTALDLMKMPVTRYKTLILIMSWAISIFVYYGISLNSSTFSNDMFISFISVCLIEIPAHFLCIIGTHFFGCKYSLTISFFFTAIMCFIGAGTQMTTGWQGIVLISLMKMGATGATDISYNISAEIFPTVVRAIGMGICSTFARVTAMISPFMKEVARMTSVSVPYSLFGILCLWTGLLLMFLPNTHNTKLPETMEESEKQRLVNPCGSRRREDGFNLQTTNYGNQ